MAFIWATNYPPIMLPTPLGRVPQIFRLTCIVLCIRASHEDLADAQVKVVTCLIRARSTSNVCVVIPLKAGPTIGHDVRRSINHRLPETLTVLRRQQRRCVFFLPISKNISHSLQFPRISITDFLRQRIYATAKCLHRAQKNPVKQRHQYSVNVKEDKYSPRSRAPLPARPGPYIFPAPEPATRPG